jgi:hypothetical protein
MYYLQREEDLRILRVKMIGRLFNNYLTSKAVHVTGREGP